MVDMSNGICNTWIKSVYDQPPAVDSFMHCNVMELSAYSAHELEGKQQQQD